MFAATGSSAGANTLPTSSALTGGLVSSLSKWSVQQKDLPKIPDGKIRAV